MNKLNVSEYCKNIRKATGLTTQAFADLHNCSRAYISKIENGMLDEEHTVAQMKRVYNKYGLTIDDLYNLNISDDFREGFILRISEEQTTNDLSFLETYLENNQYHILHSESHINCDMRGINNEGHRFYLKRFLPFATSRYSADKKKQIIMSNVINFFIDIVSSIRLDASSPIELIIFTTSDIVYNALENYKEEMLGDIRADFLRIKVLFLNTNRYPKEFYII